MSELEGKTSVTPSQKLGLSLVATFCLMVAILLLVLYFPKEPTDKELTADATPSSLQDSEFTDSSKKGIVSLADIGRTLEDLGIVFLTAMAVGCIVIGLGCLMCTFCCLL